MSPFISSNFVSRPSSRSEKGYSHISMLLMLYSKKVGSCSLWLLWQKCSIFNLYQKHQTQHAEVHDVCLCYWTTICVITNHTAKGTRLKWWLAVVLGYSNEDCWRETQSQFSWACFFPVLKVHFTDLIMIDCWYDFMTHRWPVAHLLLLSIIWLWSLLSRMHLRLSLSVIISVATVCFQCTVNL